MTGRQKVAALVAEFLGTYVLATAMLAMLVRTNFEFFSAAAAAVVYGGMILIFGKVSGSHLNPVVSIGLWTMRKLSTVETIAFVVVQLAAGFVAWRGAQYFLNQALSKTAKTGLDWRVLIAEAVGTLVFTFAVAAVVSRQVDNTTRAVVSGLALFAGISIASLASNGLLNPAVAIAVRSVSWAYIVGPLVGALVGMNLYTLVFTDSVVSSVKTKTAKKTTKK
jgi:glycerol uptake facilitator-like aquaporin